ncbi:hypothetical protein P9X10_01065 [Bacillus cereus]|nr:hypothetical protein [Bacillus cereus]
MVRLLDELTHACTLVSFESEGDSERKLDYLKEVNDFIMGGSYTEANKKEYILRNYRKPIQEQLDDLGISRATYYRNKRTLESDLEKALGNEIISSIQRSEFDLVDKILDNVTVDYSPTKVVIPSIVKRIESEEHNKDVIYGLEECIDEITFLKRYSNLDLEVLLSRCDINKLNYLLRLLDLKESDVKARIRLVEVIKQNKEGTLN